MSLENNDSFGGSNELLNIQAEAIIDHLRKKFKINTQDIIYFTNTNGAVNYKVKLRSGEIATGKFEITNLGYVVDESPDSGSIIDILNKPIDLSSILNLNSKK